MKLWFTREEVPEGVPNKWSGKASTVGFFMSGLFGAFIGFGTGGLGGALAGFLMAGSVGWFIGRTFD